MDECPSPQSVARRAFALAIFVYRGSYERKWPEAPRGLRKQLSIDVEDMGAFLEETRLQENLSSNERALFSRPLGEWHRQDVTNVGWRGENLLLLLWSLGRIHAMPPIWRQSVGVHFFVDEEAERWESFVSQATSRSADELKRMEGYVQAVRIRERTPDIFEGIPWLAQKAEDYGGDPAILGDLPIDGRSFREASTRLRNDVRSVALERHKALYWLLGFEDDLDAPAPEL